MGLLHLILLALHTKFRRSSSEIECHRCTVNLADPAQFIINYSLFILYLESLYLLLLFLGPRAY